MAPIAALAHSGATATTRKRASVDQATAAVLVALSILLVKHFVCDFVLQTPYVIRGKGIYGHPGGLIHAGLHGIGTLPVFLIYPAPAGLAAGIVFAEMLVHYHIDWLKERIVRAKGWTSLAGTPFWIALGVDQLLHQLTYVAIVAVLAAATVPALA